MKVTGIYIYPVKGLGGISLPASKLLTTGLEYDRQWMLVDHKGMFVTQRQLPQLATINCQLSTTQLILSSRQESMAIELSHLPEISTPVTVWNSSLNALDEGEIVSDWFTHQLGLFRGKPLRLVRFNPTETRHINAKYQKQDEAPQHYYFADGFPYLICSEQSLNYLNEHLEAKGETRVPMDRFRPNIVFDEIDVVFTELGALTLTTETLNSVLSLRKPCERCPVTTVNQLTGERNNPFEPLKTLTELNPLNQAGAFFGGNGVLTRGEGNLIKLGDTWKLA